MNFNGSGGGGAAPTGCYKCGRPGHWSRDCPSDANSSKNNDDNNSPFPSNSEFNSKAGSRPLLPPQKSKQKSQKRTRPKLTPDLLLSDAGIGYILRYFPRALKCRGRGHEVDDLKHLLGLYAEWHSRLLPYYNFEQFIHKVEQVGSTKRVKVCLRNLREKVENGMDATMLHESQVQQDIGNQDTNIDQDGQSHLHENDLHTDDMNNFMEDTPQGISEVFRVSSSEAVPVENTAADTNRVQNVPDQTLDSNAGVSTTNQMSEEQQARMEANKLKALERAAARNRLLHA